MRFANGFTTLTIPKVSWLIGGTGPNSAIGRWRRGYYNDTSPYGTQFLPAPPAARSRTGYRGSVKIRRSAKRRYRSGYDRIGGGYGRMMAVRRSGRGIASFPVATNSIDAAVSLTLTTGLGVSSSQATGAIMIGCIQGTSAVGARIGRYVILKSLEICGEIQYNPGTTANASDVAHIFLIVDTQTNGSYPGASDVWSTTTAGNQVRNLDNTQRFKILKHWAVNFQATVGVPGTGANGTLGIIQKNFHKYVKLPNILMDFASSTGAIAEVKTNNLIVGYGSSQGVCSFTGVFRCRYQSK